MTVPAETSGTSAEPLDQPRLGLRVRLWIGALAGALAAVVAGTWLFWLPESPFAVVDAPELANDLLIAGGLVVVIALAAAWWLDRGIVARVRRITRSARRQDAAPLHEPSAGSGWGELGDLGRHLSALIMAHRHAVRSEAELQSLDRELDGVRDSVRRWIETERWSALPQGTGSVQKVADTLNHAMARQAEVQDQNLEAAQQVRADLDAAVSDARETAEQAEGGFVEATALLTTIRELERLGGELQSGLAKEPPALGARDLPAEIATLAAPLARGADVLREISDQVQVLGNRATLVALHAVLAARPGATAEAAAAVRPEELKVLAREARAATDRVQALARELGGQVRAAVDRIAALQQREPLPAPAPLAPDAARAVDRVREMIQDAARKSERLSAAGERASRAADRLVRRLDEEIRDLDGLVVRLSPPPAARGAAASFTGTAQARAESFGIVELQRPEIESLERPERREERP